jgi:hypothetical protein
LTSLKEIGDPRTYDDFDEYWDHQVTAELGRVLLRGPKCRPRRGDRELDSWSRGKTVECYTSV